MGTNGGAGRRRFAVGVIRSGFTVHRLEIGDLLVDRLLGASCRGVIWNRDIANIGLLKISIPDRAIGTVVL
jgi:hypothetical protein